MSEQRKTQVQVVNFRIYVLNTTDAVGVVPSN